MKGIGFTDIHEARAYGDYMYGQGYEVDIVKFGENKYRVFANEPPVGQKPKKPKVKLAKRAKTILKPTSRIVGRGLRHTSEMDISGGRHPRIGEQPSPSHIYDPTKEGGQMPRIAQLPRLE